MSSKRKHVCLTLRDEMMQYLSKQNYSSPWCSWILFFLIRKNIYIYRISTPIVVHFRIAGHIEIKCFIKSFYSFDSKRKIMIYKCSEFVYQSSANSKGLGIYKSVILLLRLLVFSPCICMFITPIFEIKILVNFNMHVQWYLDLSIQIVPESHSQAKSLLTETWFPMQLKCNPDTL